MALRSHAYFLEITQTSLEPQGEVLDLWMRNIHLSDEIWVIPEPFEFQQMLQRMDLDPATIDEILASVKSDFLDHRKYFYSFYNPVKGKAYISPSAQLKAKIPGQILSEIYKMQLDLGFEKRMSIRYSNRKTLNDWIDTLNISELLKSKWKERVFFNDQGFHLLVSPEVWQAMGEGKKMKIIRQLADTEQRSRFTPLQIELYIEGEQDLKKVAKAFAGNRSAKRLERKLRKEFKKTPRYPIKIALQDILPSFIRSRIHSFSPVSGPNCAHSGICVGRAGKFQATLVYEPELEANLLDRYTPVDSFDLKFGDLLLYRDQNGSLVHVSTYIDQGVVFTKNGSSRFAPYMFQYMSENQEYYSVPGGLELEVHRPISEDSPHFCRAFIKSLLNKN